MLTFTPITLEHHALLRKYYAGCDYHLCEYPAGSNTRPRGVRAMKPSLSRYGS